jgi:thiamine-monophosphate kinase
MSELTIAELGEKKLIEHWITPLFNPRGELAGVGDDCGMIRHPDGSIYLFSTDRVPADLIPFQLGILDFRGLGQYLARLNISDIAACGGRPNGLLLNLGVPPHMKLTDFVALCEGFGEVASRFNCSVLGGDISSADPFSISATSIGIAESGRVLTRRGAKPGDWVFTSRPLGLTPAAFAYFLRSDKSFRATHAHYTQLSSQFTSLDPLVELGLKLCASDACTTCMDNTDGLGQSLLELAAMSGVAIVVNTGVSDLPRAVVDIANHLDEDPVTMAYGAGIDLSLVGTLDPLLSKNLPLEEWGITIIGSVRAGAGLYREEAGEINPLKVSGWNYFSESEFVIPRWTATPKE